MLHLYSKGCEYAFRALMRVSRRECREGFSVKAVCRKARLPESFTRKAFQSLVKSRVLAAKRGPGGGYRFMKDPRKVPILRIIHAIDGRDGFDKCVLKDSKCDNGNGFCSLHPMWIKTKAGLIREFQQSSVAELIIREEDK